MPRRTGLGDDDAVPLWGDDQMAGLPDFGGKFVHQWLRRRGQSAQRRAAGGQLEQLHRQRIAVGLTKSIAANFVRGGIRCNALCPGTVDTPQPARPHCRRRPGTGGTGLHRTPVDGSSHGRRHHGTVVYLLSDESRFVSGQALLVNGGVTV